MSFAEARDYLHERDAALARVEDLEQRVQTLTMALTARERGLHESHDHPGSFETCEARWCALAFGVEVERLLSARPDPAPPAGEK